MTEDREERTKGVGGNEVSLMPGMGVGAEESRKQASISRKESPSAVSDDAARLGRKWYSAQDNSRADRTEGRMLEGDLSGKAEQGINGDLGGMGRAAVRIIF